MGNNSSMVSVMFEEIKGLLLSIEKKLGEKAIYQENISAPETTSESKSGTKTNPVNPDQLIRLIAAHLQKMEQKTERVSEAVRESGKQMLSKIEEMKRIAEYQKPESQVRHYHVIDLKSSKVMIAIVSLSILLLFSLFGNIRQFKVNSRMKDNDLKYRYILSTNGIRRDKLDKLEDVFHYHRDKKKIREIREKVEGFERRLKKTVPVPPHK